jgi:hypothetical protein
MISNKQRRRAHDARTARPLAAPTTTAPHPGRLPLALSFDWTVELKVKSSVPTELKLPAPGDRAERMKFLREVARRRMNAHATTAREIAECAARRAARDAARANP